MVAGNAPLQGLTIPLITPRSLVSQKSAAGLARGRDSVLRIRAVFQPRRSRPRSGRRPGPRRRWRTPGRWSPRWSPARPRRRGAESGGCRRPRAFASRFGPPWVLSSAGASTRSRSTGPSRQAARKASERRCPRRQLARLRSCGRTRCRLPPDVLVQRDLSLEVLGRDPDHLRELVERVSSSRCRS